MSALLIIYGVLLMFALGWAITGSWGGAIITIGGSIGLIIVIAGAQALWKKVRKHFRPENLTIMV